MLPRRSADSATQLRCRFTASVLVVLLATGLIACGERPPDAQEALSSAAERNAPLPGRASVDRPFVAFSQREIYLSQTDTPVPLPLSPGSVVTPGSLRSEDPTIARLEPSGEIVGLRTGRTRLVASAGDASLTVVVHGVTSLRIEPPVITLRPGETSTLRLLDPQTGTVIPAHTVTWRASNPVVTVRNGEVRAGARIGVAMVMAELRDLTASVDVHVAAEGQSFTVLPSIAHLQPGEVMLFQAYPNPVASAPAWSTQDRRVIAPLGQGLFQALKAGRTKICAASGGSTACTTVEVAP